MDCADISRQKISFNEEYDFWREMYSEPVKKIQELIEEECDKLDFEGSFLFAVRPAEYLLRKISRNIVISLPERLQKEVWVRELVDVLMWDEIYKRRVRRNQYIFREQDFRNIMEK